MHYLLLLLIVSKIEPWKAAPSRPFAQSFEYRVSHRRAHSTVGFLTCFIFTFATHACNLNAISLALVNGFKINRQFFIATRDLLLLLLLYFLRCFYKFIGVKAFLTGHHLFLFLLLHIYFYLRAHFIKLDMYVHMYVLYLFMHLLGFYFKNGQKSKKKKQRFLFFFG